jgi:hypothetical protein
MLEAPPGVRVTGRRHDRRQLRPTRLAPRRATLARVQRLQYSLSITQGRGSLKCTPPNKSNNVCIKAAFKMCKALTEL